MYFELFAKASTSFTMFTCLKSSTGRSLHELLTYTVSGFTTKGGDVTLLIQLFTRSSDITFSTKVECLRADKLSRSITEVGSETNGILYPNAITLKI